MRNLKKFGVVMVAAIALTAIAAPAASAGTFTATVTGAITGLANSTHEFNVNGTAGGAINRVSCNGVHTTGTINATDTKELSFTVAYASCSAFLGIIANVTSASVTFTAGVATNNDVATVDLNNTVTITVGSGANACNIVVKPQGLHNVDFNNLGANAITKENTINDINSTGNGGVCGSGHISGSYAGMSTITSAGTLRYDTNP